MRPHRSLFACGLVPFALALAACGESDLCDDLMSSLSECDLQAAAPTCVGHGLFDELELKAALDAEGCAGLYDADTGMVKEQACRVFGWECPAPLFDVESPRATHHTVVFVSGIDENPLFDWSDRILDAVREETGSEVFHAPLPGWASTEERAEALWSGLATLKGQRGGELRVNLICYAVGGTDCRYLTSPTGLFLSDAEAFEDVVDTVASVTTISTPHLGTNVADALLALPSSELSALVAGGTLGGARSALDDREEQMRASLTAITLDAGAAMNAMLLDDPRIYRQSWAAVSRATDEVLPLSEGVVERWCQPSVLDEGARFAGFVHHGGADDTLSEVLAPIGPFSEVAEIPDRTRSPADGLVSVHSARWSNFRGCVPADHYDVIGRIGDDGVDPITGFDAVRFYLSVVDDLAERGL